MGRWIGRIYSAALTPQVRAILAPYLAAVAAANPNGELRYYPGSPAIVRSLLRDGDRMIVNELHPEEHASLVKRLTRDRQVKVMGLDGWQAVKSLLPPRERRGVVMVDAPFEEAGEFDRLAQAIRDFHDRFATGTLLLWYPIKDQKPVAALLRKVTQLHIFRILCAELFVAPDRASCPVTATGVLAVNPTYRLYDQLEILPPFLVTALVQRRGCGMHRIRWLSGEPVKASAGQPRD